MHPCEIASGDIGGAVERRRLLVLFLLFLLLLEKSILLFGQYTGSNEG